MSPQDSENFEFETSLKCFYSENKKMARLRLISGLVTNPKFHRRYLLKYNEPDPEFLPPVLCYLSSVS
jgi:hypothetical protein